VLSCRGLCDEVITSPEDSYRLWCVTVCDVETSRMRRPWLTLGCILRGGGGGGDITGHNSHGGLQNIRFSPNVRVLCTSPLTALKCITFGLNFYVAIQKGVMKFCST
jgi:hypothetical protein